VPYCKEFRPHEKHFQILLSCRDLFGNGALDLRDEWGADELFNYLQFPGGHGIGEFLSFQIMLDLSYCPAFKIHGLEDFAYVGPGAEGAMDYLRGGKCADYLNELKLLHVFLKGYFKLQKITGYDLSITDVEACLCEFRKYINLRDGKGRRRYYKGANKNELF